jgi:hypothetical protein
MSKSPNKKCWDEYCRSGGVRYEFEYCKAHSQMSEVSSSDVIYGDNQMLNLPNYLVTRELDFSIKNLLQKRALTKCDLFRLLIWLKRGIPNQYACDHIEKEIVFKKTTNFRYEDEYRFVHLTEKIGAKPLKINLNHQKTDPGKIGLKLVRISTSDIQMVKNQLSNTTVEISNISFC